MSSAVAAPPVVLVVEDRKKALEFRLEALTEAGCTTIGVQSHDDAIRELRASPGVDLVLTDIHLAKQRDDKSGVALARYIKDVYKGLPVAGYSAVFFDKDLSVGDEEPFDHIWPKAQLDVAGIDQMVSICRAEALAHRQRRAETAFEIQAVLRRRHEAVHPEVELLRELRLGGGESEPVESVLSDAGYRLRLVEANVGGLAEPTILWLLPVGDGVEAEVYGQPALYAQGASDEEAVADVIELMHLYGAEIGPDAPEAVGPARSLTEFLRRVLADERAAE